MVTMVVSTSPVGLGEHHGGADLHRLDSAHIHGLKIASIVVAGISVASAILSLLWFIRMKRSFRHEYGLLSSPCLHGTSRR
jgi:hypothetical protein